MKQNSCKIIGITGGIATGKSTVTNMIREKGHIVIDADKIARNVVEKKQPSLCGNIGFFLVRIF